MPIGTAAAIITGGASLASGFLGSKGAKDAAGAQAEGLRDAAKIQSDIADKQIAYSERTDAQNRADLAPWRAVGMNALARLGGYRTSQSAFGNGALGQSRGGGSQDGGFKSIGKDADGIEQYSPVAPPGSFSNAAIYYKGADGRFTMDKSTASSGGGTQAPQPAQPSPANQALIKQTQQRLQDIERQNELDGYSTASLPSNPEYARLQRELSQFQGPQASQDPQALQTGAADGVDQFYSDQDFIGGIDSTRSFNPGAEYDQAHLFNPGAEYGEADVFDPGGEFTSALNFDFDTSKLAEDPGYQFELEQGQRALTNMQRASGLRLSGRAMEDTSKFSQGLASTKVNEAFQRQLSSYGTRVSDLLRRYGVATDRYSSRQQDRARRYGVATDQYASDQSDRARRYGVATDKFNVGTSERDSAFNRLAGLAGVGQVATNQINSSASANSASVNAALRDQGAAGANAAAGIGAANANAASASAGSWNNAIQGFGAGLQANMAATQQQTNFINALDRLAPIRGGGVTGTSGYNLT